MLVYVSPCRDDFLWHHSCRAVLKFWVVVFHVHISIPSQPSNEPWGGPAHAPMIFTVFSCIPIDQTRLPVLALATVQLINFWCGYSDITWSRHLDVVMTGWPSRLAQSSGNSHLLALCLVAWEDVGVGLYPNHIVANVVDTLPIVLWLGNWMHQIAFCQNRSRPFMTFGFHSEIFWSCCWECFENYTIACGDYAILFATCIRDDIILVPLQR